MYNNSLITIIILFTILLMFMLYIIQSNVFCDVSRRIVIDHCLEMDASTSKTLTTAHTSETIPTAHTSETVPTAQAQQLSQDSGAAVLSHEAHAQQSSQDGGAAELSHEELMEVTSTALNDLLKTVTILADLPQDVTLEEVNAQIAVQHGQSITVYAVREDGEEIAAVVNQKGARVIDLKHAIRRAVDLKLKRTGKIGKVSEKRKISWKYVWKTNHLSFDGEQLSNDQALLSELGIRNKSRVTFVKRLREKGTVKR